MKVTRHGRCGHRSLIVAAASVHALAGAASPGQPRRRRPTPVAKLVAEPASLTVRAGEAVALKVTAYDAAGKPIPDAVVRVNLPRRSGHLCRRQGDGVPGRLVRRDGGGRRRRRARR